MEPTCPDGMRKELSAWLRERAGSGAQWAADALLLQPCDLFPLIKGRNVWVAGDSMSQVPPLPFPPSDPLPIAATCFPSACPLLAIGGGRTPAMWQL